MVDWLRKLRASRHRRAWGRKHALWLWGGPLWWGAFAAGIVIGAAVVLIGAKGVVGSGQQAIPSAVKNGLPTVPADSGTSGQDESDKPDKPENGQSKSTPDDMAMEQLARRLERVSVKSGQEPSAGSEEASGESDLDKPYNDLDKLRVRVYMTGTGRIETVPLEIYVRGVLAGEMPVDFELEALKAQAVAARTYIVRRLASKDKSGVPGGKADVTDTVDHQVYIPLKKLIDKWPAGPEREAALGKLERAVQETKGMVLTYEGAPIEAAFFSTSNGYTENADEYWQLSLPYLQSVASPWDKNISPRYKQTVEMSEKELYRRLGAKDDGKPPRILETTEGHRIKEIVVGGETFTGREVREKLDLASSQFEWTIQGGTATITTYGLGHGIGMSQWGANGMAKEGATAKQILLHYYTGVKVEQAYKLPDAGS
ncbi:stage II sporulation protein D [Paenibacillus kobensis]|uniref:stage II sporulation protein D n=1 Tax=Paenibacillus kobensis TaxID=59841 RepID=UPI000FD782A1|nr:stage II sporulation protein D [Paenibacillus kobensis]